MQNVAPGVAAERFDAIIIGGGPGGATAAAILAKAGWSTVVVEQQVFPRRKVCGEYLSATNWPLLEGLGASAAFAESAGPEVRRVALLSGRSSVTAELPPGRVNGSVRWGRALSRERLDTLLLRQAQDSGAFVLQPWQACELERCGDGFRCVVVCQASAERRTLFAPIVVAAHGSWAAGPLPTQLARRSKRGAHLLGFKATFLDTNLHRELMPLVSFRDGYGGLVHDDDRRVSFSCCIQRDRLERLARDGRSAGDTLLDYLFSECAALQETLGGARRELPWLAAGPIRPGMRRCYTGGLFLVGNAAGEAHPVVAEGISMAMQAGWLLAKRLAASDARTSAAARDAVGKDYTVAWRRAFAPRIHAAGAIAHWAMRPGAVSASLPIIRRCPHILTWGAWCSGKTLNVWTGGDQAASAAMAN
jgi:flavin-dependent dehydrogenase